MPKPIQTPTLDALFDSPVRTRILKLFLYSPETDFDLKTISRILNIRRNIINKNLAGLSEIKFLNSKIAGGRKVFKTNQKFGFYEELKNLACKAVPVSKEKMIKRLNGLGKIKLVLVAGVFINTDSSRADLLVVGDNIKEGRFGKFLRELESEAGKEINYALMTTKEFNYRLDMYDRFIRDLLDFKHEKLINKLRI